MSDESKGIAQNEGLTTEESLKPNKRPIEQGIQQLSPSPKKARMADPNQLDMSSAASSSSASASVPAPSSNAPQPTAGKVVGKVKWFDVKKGFGFITRDGSSVDYFVHQTCITSTRPGYEGLANDEVVEFYIEEENGKPRASGVAAVGGGACLGQQNPNMYSQMRLVLPHHTTTQLPPGRHRGHCKWFSVAKGFGFIIPTDGTPEVFVHQSDLKTDRRQHRSLQEKENVEFTLLVEEGENKKRKAVDVTGPGGANVIGQPIPPPPQPIFSPGPSYGAPYGGQYPAAPQYAAPSPYANTYSWGAQQAYTAPSSQNAYAYGAGTGAPGYAGYAPPSAQNYGGYPSGGYQGY